MSRGLILGIESSCDETAAAVVDRGARTLSSVVASQIATHATYGGVVPELASREHLRAIVPVVRAALAEAQVTLADVDAIAVTSGPGLAGGGCSARSVGDAVPLVEVSQEEQLVDLLNLPRSLTRADATDVGGQVCGLVGCEPTQHQHPMRCSRAGSRRVFGR